MLHDEEEVYVRVEHLEEPADVGVVEGPEDLQLGVRLLRVVVDDLDNQAIMKIIKTSPTRLMTTVS